MENQFIDGLFFDRPREGAPEFVKGRMSIQAQKLMGWMQNNKQFLSDKGWYNLDLLQSKDGTKLYFKLNTFKPKVKDETTLTPEEQQFLRERRELAKVIPNAKVEPTDDDWNSVPF